MSLYGHLNADDAKINRETGFGARMKPIVRNKVAAKQYVAPSAFPPTQAIPKSTRFNLVTELSGSSEEIRAERIVDPYNPKQPNDFNACHLEFKRREAEFEYQAIERYFTEKIGPLKTLKLMKSEAPIVTHVASVNVNLAESGDEAHLRRMRMG